MNHKTITVPWWLLRRKEVSPGAKLLYAKLAHASLRSDTFKMCTVDSLFQRGLAKSLGASERSVRNWLNQLERVGLVRKRFLGWSRANFYQLPDHPWQKE